MSARPRAYSPEEVANTIPGLTGWTVREYVRRGQIGALRIGGRRRIALTEDHIAELLALLEEHATQAPAPATAQARRGRTPAPSRPARGAPAVELRARPPRRKRKAGGGPDEAA